MNTTMTLGDAIAVLEREIEDRQRAVAVLRAMLDPAPSEPERRAAPANARGAVPAKTVGGAAAEILKAAGRPMHAIRELLPLLQEKGVKVSKQTLPTALSRQGDVRRVDAGVWAHTSVG